MAVTQPESGTSPGKRVDAGYCGRCSSSCKTDIRQPSFEVMPHIADLFGVTVDYLLCRGGKRFLDISALSDQEAVAVCGMTEILKQQFLRSKERLWFHAAIKNLQ